jgi:hypothetical protein
MGPINHGDYNFRIVKYTSILLVNPFKKVVRTNSRVMNFLCGGRKAKKILYLYSLW